VPIVDTYAFEWPY